MTLFDKVVVLVAAYNEALCYLCMNDLKQKMSVVNPSTRSFSPCCHISTSHQFCKTPYHGFKADQLVDPVPFPNTDVIRPLLAYLLLDRLRMQ